MNNDKIPIPFDHVLCHIYTCCVCVCCFECFIVAMTMVCFGCIRISKVANNFQCAVIELRCNLEWCNTIMAGVVQKKKHMARWWLGFPHGFCAAYFIQWDRRQYYHKIGNNVCLSPSWRRNTPKSFQHTAPPQFFVDFQSRADISNSKYTHFFLLSLSQYT